MGPPDSRWQAISRLSPLTRSLLVFVPLACLALNLLLPHLPWQPQRITTLDYTQTWISGVAHEDSWKPMRRARAWLHEAHPGRLYQQVFFEEGLKLQYPPTSLLALDGLALLPGRGWTSNEMLNGISWIAVVLTAALSVAVMLRRRDPVGAPAPGPAPAGERGLQIVLGLAAALTFYPLVFGFYLGQVQTWIDALVAGLVLAWLAGRPATAGVLSGLVCLIKPQLGLLVVWAALRGQRRFAAGWLVVVVLAGVLSIALYGFVNHLDYLAVLSYIGRHGESFNHNQSVNGLVHRLLRNGNNLEWVDAFPPFDARVYAATLLFGIALMGAALGFRRREAASAPGIDLAIVIASVTIASPIAWTHHYGVFLPLFALALPEALAPGRGRALLLSLLAVSYLLVANNYRALNRLADTPWNFLQSYVLAGGLLFVFLLYRLRGRAAHAP